MMLPYMIQIPMLNLCPRIVKKLQDIEKSVAGLIGYQCGENDIEITGMSGTQHGVDLERKICTCRLWDLTGIPCKHDVCAIWLKYGRGPADAYVHPCYTKEAYLKINVGTIKPMAGKDEWPINEKIPLLPPVYSARPGRPSKLRRKLVVDLTNDGVRVVRTHIKMHCTKCRKEGHNARRCPEDPNNQEKLVNGVMLYLCHLLITTMCLITFIFNHYPFSTLSFNLEKENQNLHQGILEEVLVKVL
ncbi:unnamed protein product [Cuscuta epithymum]|uniref:SWIM-type domain-containing protein n=1 Tax=Cuscuta epithymum TaxID=186058 RepID=A0AAV0G847_9ASTE|nr:unnamed protein product [Cuscuta epithymum]CAH9113976.1 unnamed protein product [Cuscuta epithymum]CAH9144140.1 unnamed protein product [Cuscuta epithymum]